VLGQAAHAGRQARCGLVLVLVLAEDDEIRVARLQQQAVLGHVLDRAGFDRLDTEPGGLGAELVQDEQRTVSDAMIGAPVRPAGMAVASPCAFDCVPFRRMEGHR